MARYPGLSPEKQERLRQYVLEKRMAPKELAAVFGVSSATIYNYLQRLQLPIYKTGDYRRFYDPSWDLPSVTPIVGFNLCDWGPWVSLANVPPHEMHPSMTRHRTLPLAAMILAESHFHRLPDLRLKCVVFRDGDYMNVDPSNLDVNVAINPSGVDTSRVNLIRELAEKERVNGHTQD